MARYRVRYVSYAAEQLSQLPRSLRTAFDARAEDLKQDPYVAGDYDKRTGSHSTTFGETVRFDPLFQVEGPLVLARFAQYEARILARRRV
jgi:hypothetical protein